MLGIGMMVFYLHAVCTKGKLSANEIESRILWCMKLVTKWFLHTV